MDDIPNPEALSKVRASSLFNGCYTSKTHAYIQLARDTLIMDDILPIDEFWPPYFSWMKTYLFLLDLAAS
jgi:hypothetical protein